MADNWQKVYDCAIGYRAEIVKDVLVESGIGAIVLDKSDSMYRFGYFEVLVSRDQVIPALKIIREDIKFK